MKRFHVHVSVRNLDESIRFYSTLFGAAPTIEKPDYAKWMLDDPRINFAISTRDPKHGVNHLGLQVQTDEELTGLEADGADRATARPQDPEARARSVHDVRVRQSRLVEQRADGGQVRRRGGLDPVRVVAHQPQQAAGCGCTTAAGGAQHSAFSTVLAGDSP